MASKPIEISVYTDEEQHARLERAAAESNMLLPDFLVKLGLERAAELGITTSDGPRTFRKFRRAAQGALGQNDNSDSA